MKGLNVSPSLNSHADRSVKKKNLSLNELENGLLQVFRHRSYKTAIFTSLLLILDCIS